MVNLKKGQDINLRKETPGLKKVLVGLGWDPAKTLFVRDIDIDASVICIDSNGEKESIVYYNKLTHDSQAIVHCGDNLTGEGDGDDEQIEIYLENVPKKITMLSIIINIYEAHKRNQHFGKVKNCFVRIVDIDTGKEILRYDIDGDYKGKTGIFVADIYRYNGEWKFKAIGEGVNVKDIREMVKIKCSM